MCCILVTCIGTLLIDSDIVQYKKNQGILLIQYYDSCERRSIVTNWQLLYYNMYLE